MPKDYRNIPYRPPREIRTLEEGSARMLLRCYRDYIAPNVGTVVISILLLSLTASSPYVIALFSKTVVDRILVVEAVPAAGAGSGSGSLEGRSPASVDRARTPLRGSAGDAADPETCLRRPVLSYARSTRPYRELKALLLEHVGPEARIFPSASLSAAFRLVEARLGVAALPRALGGAHVAAGRLREFDPGWVPAPLRFTASWLGEPGNTLAEKAARMAQEVARCWQADNEVR